jgi:hypothetical protein
MTQSWEVNSVTDEILVEAYQEELLAHDIYAKLIEAYPSLSEVQNIIESEAMHQEQVWGLLAIRWIPLPTEYWVYTDTYNTLLAMINESLSWAIEAGVMIETGDIKHLLEEYKRIEDKDVRMVFENIGGWSYNHLRAFLRLAEENDYIVATEYSSFLTPDEVGSTGSLKSKMTELLVSNNLPVYWASQWRRWGQGQGRWMGEY